MRAPNIAARSRFLPVCGALLLLSVPAACTKKALQRLDGGGGGILPPPTDAGPGFDGAAADSLGVTDAGNGATDTAWDVAFAGRRSFDVTSHVNTGGVEIVHTFTMTLDPDQRIAVIGTPGSGDVVEVEQTAGGGLRLLLGVGRTFAFAIPAVAACGASIVYDDFRFIVDASGQLSGTGHGLWATYAPSGGTNLPVTMVLEGAPDAEPPTLSLVAGGDLADPWTPLWVVASEPLPSEQPRPALRSTGGDFQSFEAQSSGNDPFVAVLARPTRLLRFGDQYRVTFDGVTDFAGHAPTSMASATFTTRPLPPLVAADGFESVTDETLGGARVLSGAGAPTINGARSLYLPPVDSLGTGSTVTQFALRLPIAPGNTVVRFSYRTVNPGDSSNIQYVVASVGGPIGTAVLPADVSGATTPTTIDQTPVTLGPIQTAAIGLPGSTYVEVVFARTASQPTSCGGPAPRPVPGVIIDDLRAE